MKNIEFDNYCINRIVVGEIDTNCYILKNNLTKSATIVDPGDEIDRIIETLDDYKLEAVLLTHGHFDHVAMVDKLAEIYDFELYIHKNDHEMLKNGDINGSSMFCNHKLEINKKASLIDDGYTITTLGINFNVIHTPGHSMGSTCYQINYKKQNILFTGDTVFKGGYGRTDLYGGNFKQLVESIRKLLKLSCEHICLCGHGEGTYIGNKSKC